ncbi:putative phosphate permease CT_962 [Waddlia chondrophila 2032/99]|uniref:Phosphate transporter n=2 Tax=Waddlia chondrophila TaxID=71667 RepID=D6YU54_WADCW|nr:inorganic phosphate transporter [Waddlia chondrophila]ADI37665.1 putative inorganic phosphate transporter [Waddlia chondrophila WSU 86-1044]CCB90512.1 putative phosphate permease CT_962 [Waddlia chondrophila 2032/99]
MIIDNNLLFGVIIIAGFYMAWNIGANDVANAMGTSVGSGALTLRQAVMIAAVLEFSGAFFFGSHVTETIQKEIVDPDLFLYQPQVLIYGMLSALLSAGAWLQLASYLGLPVSTTHSIVGAVVGFGAVVGGIDAIKWVTVFKIVASWVISPLAGGVFAYYFFCFLRKKIFYSFNPVKAAQRITPLLVFLVAVIMTQIVGLSLIDKAAISISVKQALLFSIFLGAVSAAISYFFVQRMTVPQRDTEQRPQYGPEIVHSLHKATKHLMQVKSSSSGELHSDIACLLDKMENISSGISRKIEQTVSHSEYAAVEKIFSYLQIITAALMAFGHGANDVANAIGPLAAAVGTLTTGVIAMQLAIPSWILALGGGGIIIGLATWGWRVIETVGKKITELTPTRGFVAEFCAATTILVASRMGMPISTTHTLVGSVLGVGLARGIEALNLGMTRDIVISWVVTVPAGAGLSVCIFYVIQWIFH